MWWAEKMLKHKKYSFAKRLELLTVQKYIFEKPVSSSSMSSSILYAPFVVFFDRNSYLWNPDS